MSQRIQQYLDNVAESEVSGPEKTRMLTLTLAAMTWVTTTGILMYVTELLGRRPAVKLATWPSIILFFGYIVISRAPGFAKAALVLQETVTSSTWKELKLSAAALVSGGFLLYAIPGSPGFVYLYVVVMVMLSVTALVVVAWSVFRGEDSV